MCIVFPPSSQPLIAQSASCLHCQAHLPMFVKGSCNMCFQVSKCGRRLFLQQYQNSCLDGSAMPSCTLFLNDITTSPDLRKCLCEYSVIINNNSKGPNYTNKKMRIIFAVQCYLQYFISLPEIACLLFRHLNDAFHVWIILCTCFVLFVFVVFHCRVLMLKLLWVFKLF